MYIEHLSLKNFRNYKNEEFSFIPHTNILYGENAQGKTNALEAVYLFSIGKSFRTTQDRELIRFGEETARAELVFSDNKRQQKIEIILRRDKKKQIKINGVVIHKLSELVGRLNVVLFCPEELGLVKEGPNVRRRFLDIALSQLRPNYYHLLGLYNKVLEQRNNLIKKIKFQNASSLADTMFVWNEKLATYGVQIAAYRSEFVKLLEGYAKKVHSEICGEELLVEYRTRVGTKEDFLEKLNNNLDKEIEQGYTLYGPHRDDIYLAVSGKDAKNFASQGQQRTIVLSLKLAQADLLFEETGEYPVLLLDDIMSELDSGRRAYLAGKILNKQAVITCTDVEQNLKTDTAKTIHIKSGAIL
ncbi:MAG: DNA replication/repair protein RecF [Clostridia bacterium]|nr:DNA replication/repair protein RecF [Clostridia bacterium]